MPDARLARGATGEPAPALASRAPGTPTPRAEAASAASAAPGTPAPPLAGSRARLVLLIVALGMLQAIWPLTMDLYLPSFPQIERELSTVPSLVQLTLTAAFIGMAIGQLVAGPVSDAIGRSRPLVIVIAVYILATASCAIAPTVDWLIASRFFQGMGSAACGVIALAIVRDTVSGDRMIVFLARLSIVSGVFVVASPALGAQLLQLVDWRGLFAILVGYGILLLVVSGSILLRHETNPPSRRALRKSVRVRDDYRVLAVSREFRGVVLANGLFFGGMMAYMASSAFLFQGIYGLTPLDYALVFGAHGALMIIGAQIGARLARLFSPTRLVKIGAVALVAAAGILLASVSLAPGLGLLGFLLPLMLFTTAFGLNGPAMQSVALTPHGLRAGTAASVLGASNMVFAAVLSPLAGYFGVSTPVPAVTIMLVCATLGALALFGHLRPRRTAG